MTRRRIILVLAAVCLSASAGLAHAEKLNGPEVWLEFMGGNVRKDGLRCDLEAIKYAGFSGVHFFHISRGEAWPEIQAGIREVGILEMDIYILGTRLVMIVETPLDFDWDSAMARLATLPRQQEWEEYMACFQNCDPTATSDEKWQMMERMFQLYE